MGFLETLGRSGLQQQLPALLNAKARFDQFKLDKQESEAKQAEKDRKLALDNKMVAIDSLNLDPASLEVFTKGLIVVDGHLQQSVINERFKILSTSEEFVSRVGKGKSQEAQAKVNEALTAFSQEVSKDPTSDKIPKLRQNVQMARLELSRIVTVNSKQKDASLRQEFEATEGIVKRAETLGELSEQSVSTGVLTPERQELAGIAKQQLADPTSQALAASGDLKATLARDVKVEERVRGVGGGERIRPEQRKIRNLPIGDDKFQVMTIDKITNVATPVLKDGKPIILTQKEVLIAEGKKAQSLIDPFETKFLSELGKSEGARLTALKTTALDAVSSKKIISEGLALLNQGIYSGTLANTKVQFDKFLQQAGISIGGRKAANTEAYAGIMGLQVGKIIQLFGAGTGLSDADREFATKIAAGDISLTEDAIRQLLDINNRLADFTITEFNDQAASAALALQTKDFLRPIEIPDFSPRASTQEVDNTGVTTTQPTVGPNSTDEEIEQIFNRVSKENPGATKNEIFRIMRGGK